MSSVDLTAIKANLGSYSRQHSKKLVGLCYQAFETELERMGIVTVDGIKDLYEMISIEVGSILRPGNTKAFNATANAVKFDNREMKVRRWKVDLQFDPEDYIESYLAHFRKASVTVTMADLPFEQFMLERIMEKLADELLDVYLNGAFVQNGATAMEMVDGLNVKLAQAVVSGHIPVVTLGAITPANVTEKLEELLSEYPHANTKGGKMIVPEQIFNWYVRKNPEDVNKMGLKFNEAAGKGTNEAGVGRVMLRASKVELIGQMKQLPNVGGVSPIFLSRPDNIMHGCNMRNDYKKFKLQENHRLIDLMIDGRLGADFAFAHPTDKPILVNEFYQ